MGLVSCTILAVSLDWATIVTGVVVLAVGFVVRWIMRRRW
jgi:hypothetical protein